MIELVHVSVTYTDASAPALRDVNLVIEEGELAVVVGRTGVGKSTLLQVINGLVPHFTGGTLAGRVVIEGRDTSTTAPRELADVVGFVGQDPLSGFVTDTVEEELAYTMEQLGVPVDVMRRRVEETLDLLGIAELRHRALGELSGGQQQRVAIGSVLTAHPKILVLDEPTSALDPTAAEEVLATITRLVHDLAVTVILAEHRLERVVQYADRVIEVRHDGTVASGATADMFERAQVAPPVIELGRTCGWRPLALSVRDARRQVAPLREKLTSRPVPAVQRTMAAIVVGRSLSVPDTSWCATARWWRCRTLTSICTAARSPRSWAATGRASRRSLGPPGLWTAPGGTVEVAGADPGALPPAQGRRLVALVPQTPADLLYHETVEQECTQADREAGDVGDHATRALLDRLAPGVPSEAHPRELSEGQRLALVLAIQLVGAPRVILLDEPTRGLDYPAKRALISILDTLAAEGHSVAISTHDVEFVAAAADRVVVMAEGEVVADGPTDEVVASSPAFAPQVAKILAPSRTHDGPGRLGTGAGALMAKVTRAIRLGHRSKVTIVMASFVGFVSFFWPFVVAPGSFSDTSMAPLMFATLLVLILAVVLAQIAEGGMDAKAIAMLGVLSALGAALRPLDAGTAGVETIFFTLVLAGRVFGAGFGFTLGCTTLFASALITGGVGPWMPYQMFACAWVGLFAGLLPPVRGRAEVAMLAVYGAIMSYAYGFLTNLSFWPFFSNSTISYVPGASVAENAHRFLIFDATTSLGFDTGRAITTFLLIVIVGPALLATFRRASRRAAFEAPVLIIDPAAAH